MKFVTRPPIDANGVGHGGDDLDEALFAFFRSEVPHPWPQLKLPDGTPPVRPAQPAPAPSRRPWFRSPHFALAASVALLIGGYAVMSAALPAPTGDNASAPRLDKDSADPTHLLPPELQHKDAPGKAVSEDERWLEQPGPDEPTTYHEIFRKK